MKTYSHTTIGLAGRAQVGKTTAASVLKNMLELHEVTIAEPVTRECASLLNMGHQTFLSLPKNAPILNINLAHSLNRDIYHALNHYPTHAMLVTLVQSAPTKRHLMQRVGKCMRTIYSHYLIQAADDKIKQHRAEPIHYDGTLVTDVRTQDEIDWILNQGGHIIHIVKPDAKKAPEDDTETDLILDYTNPRIHLVQNIGSFENYLQRLKHIAQEFQKTIANTKKAA